MSTQLTPWAPVEQAIMELIETRYPDSAEKVGGDLSFQSGDGFYVYFALIGGGSDDIYGDWIVDIDVFGDLYSVAMDHARAIEAALIGRRHQTSIMRIDNCYQNQGPTERPWDTENVFRIGATYAFTARRSG